MVDSIRSQGWDLGINISGLENLTKTNDMVDNLSKKLQKLSQLSTINVPSPNISGLDKLDSRLSEIEHKLNNIRAGSSNTGVHINTNGIDTLTRSTENSYRSINRNIDATNKYKSSLSGMLPTVNSTSNSIRTGFGKVEDSAHNATSATEVLNGKFHKISDTSINTSDHISRIGNRAGKTDKSFGSLSSTGSGLINTFNNITLALVPLGMAFKTAFDNATKLDNEYNIIKNLEVANNVSPKSAKRTVGKMRKANRQLSLKYGVDQNDLARGSEELIRRGYSGKQDLASHKYFAQSALATNESYNDIIASNAPVIEQFGYKAKAGNSVGKMRRYTKNVLNKMAYIADITAGNNKEFGESFKYMGTAMHQNKQSLDTALGAVGTLSNFGIDGSMAGTSLRQIVSRLNRASRSKTIKAALGNFGITPADLYNRKGDLKPLTTIFDMLNRGARRRHMTSGAESGNLQEIFGQWAFNAAQTLLDHSDDWKRNVRKSRSATGKNYIGNLANKNMNTLQGQIAITRQRLSDVGMKFAKDIAPALTTVLKALNNVLDWLGKLPKPVRKAMTFVTLTGAGIGAARIGKGIFGGIGRLLGFGSKVGSASAGAGAGIFTGILGKKLGLGAGTGGKLFSAGNIISVGAGALQGGIELAQGVDANANRKYGTRNNLVGKGIGSLAGTGIGFALLGAPGAMIGSQIGEFVGGVGGDAVTGYNLKHAPKNKISGQNIGWSFHNWQKQVGSWWNQKGGAGENLSNFGKWAGNSWNGTKRNVNNFGKWVGDSWNGTKRNVNNFGKWVGDSWNGTKHNVGSFFGGIGKGINAVGSGIGSGINYVTSGKIGSDIHSTWKKAIGVSHDFFKGLPKQFENFKKTANKTWDDTWKSINDNRYVKAFKKGQLIKTGLSDIEKNTRGFRQKIGSIWNGTWKSINDNRYVKAFKKGHLIKTGLSDIEKNTRSFRQKFGKNWNGTWSKASHNFDNFKKDVNKKWNNVWGVINSNRYVKAFKKGNLFGQVFSDINSRFNSFQKPFRKQWDKFWSYLKSQMKSFGKWASDSWTGSMNNVIGTLNNVIGFGNDVNYAFGGNGKAFKYFKFKKFNGSGNSHKTKKSAPTPARAAGRAVPLPARANGGRIAKSSYALVGEKGAELAYKDGSSFARLLGLNGASVEKVHAGEHILNARDTHKVLHGGLGSTLGAYANGTNSLGAVSHSYDKINKKTKDTWDSVLHHTKRSVTATKHSVLSSTTSMSRRLNKNMDSIHDSVIETANKTAKGFGKKFGKLKGYTADAMEDTKHALNKGIAGINKMLVQFGGNSSVIKPVKFAKGSNGKVGRNTLAMVNDASTGPRQEAIVNDKGIFLPKGDNSILALDKDDQVLNGYQTAKLANMFGLSHFAKGSGVSDSQLEKIAKRNFKDPLTSFDNMFTKNVSSSGPDIQAGTTITGKKASRKLGVKWSQAMWSVINQAMGGEKGHGGTREAFLRYAEDHFDGKPYRMGGTGPNYYDCSGMVSSALAHFGINIGRTTVAMQASKGLEYLGKDLNKTMAGDLAIYGHGSGAAGHVGIIKNPSKDTMFNATVPSARVSSISGPMGMGYGFYRVKGLHDASKKADKANSRLEKLAKKELGPSALKWISKHLGADLSGFSLGGDLGSRVISLAKALRQLDSNATKNGIAAIIGNWLFESQLNPGAVNSGGGASGLGQWLGGRLANLKSFAKKRGKSWKDPATQLLFALKHDGSDSKIFKSVLEGGGSVTALANKFSSQWERGGYNAQHVNGAKQAQSLLGYRNGGSPTPHTKVRWQEDTKENEQGEIAEFQNPVHIYSKDDVKNKITGKDVSKKVASVAPKQPITINITGNYIDSDERQRSIENSFRKIAEEVIANQFDKLTDNFGDDLSFS